MGHGEQLRPVSGQQVGDPLAGYPGLRRPSPAVRPGPADCRPADFAKRRYPARRHARLLGRSHGPDPVHPHHLPHPRGGLRRRRPPRYLGQHPDALASTAHYLQSSGYKRGQPWGFEVQVPAGFDWWLADGSQRKSVSEWLQLGVKLPTGTQLPANSSQLSAALLLPAGARGPAFLVLDNFRAILKYNNSSSYALAVNLLGDRFSTGASLPAAGRRTTCRSAAASVSSCRPRSMPTGMRRATRTALSAPTPARPSAMRSRRRAGRPMATRRTSCSTAYGAENVSSARPLHDL